MKKSFFQIVMGALVLSLGFTSCKKDEVKSKIEKEKEEEKEKICVDCIEFTDDYGTYTYCVGDTYMETKEEFDSYVAYIQSVGYTVRPFEKCEE
jgi:hypothetical protein